MWGGYYVILFFTLLYSNPRPFACWTSDLMLSYSSKPVCYFTFLDTMNKATTNGESRVSVNTNFHFSRMKA